MAFTIATGALYPNTTTRCGGFYWPTNNPRIIGYHAKLQSSFNQNNTLIYPRPSTYFYKESEDNDYIYFYYDINQQLQRETFSTFIDLNTIRFNAYQGFTDASYHDIPLTGINGIQAPPPALNTSQVDGKTGVEVSNLDLSYFSGSLQVVGVTYENTPVKARYEAVRTGDGSFEEINNIGCVHSEAQASVYINGITKIETTYNKQTQEIGPLSFIYSDVYAGWVQLMCDNRG